MAGSTVIHITDRMLYGKFRLPLAIRPPVVVATGARVIADSVKVLFVMAGWAVVTHEHGSLPLGPGNIVVVPSRVEHAISSVGFMEGVAAFLRPDFLEVHLRWLPSTHPLMQQLRRAHTGAPTVGVLDVGSHGIHELRAKLSVLAALAGVPSSEFAVLARVADVFDQVAFLISRNPGARATDAVHRPRPVIPHAPVVAAARALHEDLGHAWTVTELAQTVAMSPSQLSRLFRHDLGHSPAAYLWSARTDRMAELLAAADITVAEASQAVGWGRGSASGRAFKRRYGMSPRVFAAAAREPGPLGRV